MWLLLQQVGRGGYRADYRFIYQPGHKYRFFLNVDLTAKRNVSTRLRQWVWEFYDASAVIIGVTRSSVAGSAVTSTASVKIGLMWTASGGRRARG